MESPEEKNMDAKQPDDEVQDTPEESTGNVFISDELDEGSEGQEGSADQPEEEPERLTGEVAVVPAATRPEQPRRSWFSRLFSPDTRAGRFLRPFLRGVALFVGAFALGMLVTYLVIFQPIQAQLQSTQAALATTQQQLDTSQTALAAAQTDVEQLNTQTTSLQQSVDTAKTRVHLLLLTKNVKDAQLALLNKNGAAAQKALDAAKQELTTIQPALQKVNANVAEGIKLRLDLASSELTRDPKTAQSDLDILNTNLTLLDELLAKQFN